MERSDLIEVSRPGVGSEVLASIGKVLDSRWIGMGPVTMEFEARVAEFLNLDTRYVVATNTGTSALHLALIIAGVGPGDEVIVPSFSFAADHQMISLAGGSPVLCDVRDSDLGIDCEKAELLITPRTRAILPLHFSGIPCDQQGVFELARRHGLRVIEDACHAFGTTIDDRAIGSYGDIACFSFDPVKILTTIDGGCVVGGNAEEGEALRRLRFLGIDRDTAARYKNKKGWLYDVVDRGFRYHMTDVNAAVGISQFENLHEVIDGRRGVCQRYNEAFSGIAGARVICDDYANISPYIYCVRIADGRRDEFIDYSNARNVSAAIHYIPAHHHKQFSKCKRGDMTVTDTVASEIVTLPLHSEMKRETVERVIEVVCSFFRT
jgi:dTDP-4-amino-4,6-dideoxygalactose transaminase